MSVEAFFEQRVYAALSANAAAPYLGRHMASHAQAANRLEDLISQTDYLANAEAISLAAALRGGEMLSEVRMSAVFRAGLDVHRRLQDRRTRAQRLLAATASG